MGWVSLVYTANRLDGEKKVPWDEATGSLGEKTKALALPLTSSVELGKSLSSRAALEHSAMVEILHTCTIQYGTHYPHVATEQLICG